MPQHRTAEKGSGLLASRGVPGGTAPYLLVL